MWRSKKQSSQATLGSGGFSLAGNTSQVAAQVAVEVANRDVAPHVENSDRGGSADVLTTGPAELKRRDLSTRPFVVPSGYNISAGTFISHRPIILRGELQGRGMSAGFVTIENTGVLRVPAEVETLCVFGRVASPVKATTFIEVMAGGNVQGSIDTPALRVAPGGRISGGQLSVGRR